MQNSFYNRFGKRIIDFILSFMGILFLLPVFLVIGLLIKFSDRGDIFYKQKRVGMNFVPFNLIKFRTMVANADRLGPPVTRGDDARITRVGKFLRKTKLDELPQLINVLKGDMSLVGPRPEVEKYVNIYRDDFKEILKIRPGITDFASIKFRNEEEILKNYENTEEGYIREVLPEKIAIYKEYLKLQSFKTDMGLILKTLWRILIH